MVGKHVLVVITYRKHIRIWLEANAGRPRGQRRSVTDPLGAPSLR